MVVYSHYSSPPQSCKPYPPARSPTGRSRGRKRARPETLRARDGAEPGPEARINRVMTIIPICYIFSLLSKIIFYKGGDKPRSYLLCFLIAVLADKLAAREVRGGSGKCRGKESASGNALAMTGRGQAPQLLVMLSHCGVDR